MSRVVLAASLAIVVVALGLLLFLGHKVESTASTKPPNGSMLDRLVNPPDTIPPLPVKTISLPRSDGIPVSVTNRNQRADLHLKLYTMPDGSAYRIEVREGRISCSNNQPIAKGLKPAWSGAIRGELASRIDHALEWLTCTGTLERYEIPGVSDGFAIELDVNVNGCSRTIWMQNVCAPEITNLAKALGAALPSDSGLPGWLWKECDRK